MTDWTPTEERVARAIYKEHTMTETLALDWDDPDFGKTAQSMWLYTARVALQASHHKELVEALEENKKLLKRLRFHCSSRSGWASDLDKQIEDGDKALALARGEDE